MKGDDQSGDNSIIHRTSSRFNLCEYPLNHESHYMTKFQIKGLKMHATGCAMCSGMDREFITPYTLLII